MKSLVMKRAWELYRTYIDLTWSMSLVIAWRIVKLDALKSEYTFNTNIKGRIYTATLKYWFKNGSFRVYVPIDTYKQAGYIDLTNKQHTATTINSNAYLRALVARI
jgi:hypothetical protein